MQLDDLPRSRALCRAGSSIAANMAMIAITTRSSIKVKLLSFTCLQTGENFLLFSILLSLSFVKYLISNKTFTLFIWYYKQPFYYKLNSMLAQYDVFVKENYENFMLHPFCPEVFTGQQLYAALTLDFPAVKN